MRRPYRVVDLGYATVSYYRGRIPELILIFCGIGLIVLLLKIGGAT